MRPVDKGEKPDNEYKKYGDAKPELIRRIGEYCSYCEFPIVHVPEVEHKEAKSTGGSWLEWDNLLLSCKYCNCRKLVCVAAGEKDLYLWPDEDDTFHAYKYTNGIPALNEDYLRNKGELYRERATRLFQLVKLNHIPDTPKDKDRRWAKRLETFNSALEELDNWKLNRTEEYKRILVKYAVASGFFSIWMEVFKDEPEMQKAFVDAFVGTKKKYFKNWIE